MSRRVVLMVGGFSGQLTGMKAVNRAVRETLEALSIDVAIVDTAAPSLAQSLPVKLRRAGRAFRGLWRVAVSRYPRSRSLYIGVSGGKGQLYDAAFVILARWKRMELYLHHHCFAYLDVPTRLCGLLIRIAGGSAYHIVQSPRMGERLARIYGARRVVSVSNAVFLLAEENERVLPRKEVRTIGFVSNICREKGVLDFLDLVEEMERRAWSVKAKLAGPFANGTIERVVRQRMARLRTLEYCGAVYGAGKEEFFRNIDVLVFPTRYRNETEGIVNHEALRRGIPVIAYGRGCIPEVIGLDCGTLVDPSEEFVPKALAQLQQWVGRPDLFRAASLAAITRFRNIYTENKRNWSFILSALEGSRSDVDTSL